MLRELAPMIVGPLIVLPLAFYALSRRQVRGATWYAALLLLLGWWSVAYVWELTEVSRAEKLLALDLKYAGIVAMPVAWMGFVLSFVGVDDRLTRRLTLAMAGWAALSMLVIWTDPWHGYFWGSHRLERSGSFLVFTGRGPGFWINTTYIYVALWAGLAILIVQAIRYPYLYRKRTIIMVSSALFPWLGNVAFVTPFLGSPLIDPTPPLFVFTAVLMAVAVFRYRILDPIPTLRDLRIEVIGDGVIILDDHDRIADLNRAAEGILQRRRADATGTRIANLLPGWQPMHPGDSRRDLIVGGPDKAVYDVQSSAVRAPGGRTTGTVIVLRDVTAHRQAEHALRDSERRYRDLVERAGDLILTLDFTGNVTSVNRSCYEITGYRPEEVIGRQVLEFVAPEYRETAKRVLQMASQTSRTREVLVIIARSGRRVALEVATWLQFRAGHAVAVQAIARDVTARLRLEAQLRESQKMEAVGKLAGGVAHDFNSLLTSIIGYATLALDELPRDSAARARLEQILRSGDQAAAVTRQLLAFGRRQILQPIVLDLNLVIRETEQVLRSMITDEVELTLELSPDTPWVKADAVQIQQVLLNLVVNARDALPVGGTVVIRTAAGLLPEADPTLELSPGRYAVLSVVDSGEGIDPAVIDHIFEPFFTTKGPGKGTGLGLSTVHGIVKQTGGEVTVTSVPGEGCTFSVYLPAAAIRDGAS